MIDGGATNIDPSITESDFDKIHLATSTFFCKSSYNGLPVCGKDDLGAHACYGAPISHGKYHCLYYDRRASNAVAALLVAANLGQNTTVAQMDDMDLRFHCPGWLKQSTRLAMSWRDAASHARSSNQLHSRSWEVFSPEEIAAIKEKEMANIGDVRFRFRCNTCAHTGWIRRQELENHLKAQRALGGRALHAEEVLTSISPYLPNAGTPSLTILTRRWSSTLILGVPPNRSRSGCLRKAAHSLAARRERP